MDQDQLDHLLVPRPDDIVDRKYRVRERIGTGGMAPLYSVMEDFFPPVAASGKYLICTRPPDYRMFCALAGIVLIPSQAG